MLSTGVRDHNANESLIKFHFSFSKCSPSSFELTHKTQRKIYYLVFQVENSLSTYEPHACVVVYSVTDRASIKVAEDILHYLWRQNFTQDKSVIVVGNKADLARARVVPTSGMQPVRQMCARGSIYHVRVSRWRTRHRALYFD
jgi:hypothetical protein